MALKGVIRHCFCRSAPQVFIALQQCARHPFQGFIRSNCDQRDADCAPNGSDGRLHVAYYETTIGSATLRASTWKVPAVCGAV